MTFDSTLC